MNGRSAKWLLVAVLSILWTFAVYLGYYTVHKPFTGATVLAVLDRVADLAIWTALLLLAAALGRRFLGRGAQTRPLEELLFSTGLGLGILSLGT
ncbi:MAG: hypothetical protein WBB22_00015, partial [Anaerolineae bacterium]